MSNIINSDLSINYIDSKLSSQHNLDKIYSEYAPLIFDVCSNCQINYKLVKRDEVIKWICSCGKECTHKIKID